MKALVTGGAGFIGHHLVQALVNRGDQVVVIDNLATGSVERLGEMQGIVFRKGDIRSPADLDVAIAGCEVVFHEAAVPSVARSIEDPALSNDVNVAGTIQVLLAGRRAGVRRLVFAGSSSVYGSGPGIPRRETQRPEPQSPYAVGKLAAEHYVHTLGALSGIGTVALRYFNVFGPGQDPRSTYAAVVPRFVTALLSGELPTIFGDGHQSRDFTFVANVVAANILAAESTETGLTCNIGTGNAVSLLELLATARELTNGDEAVRFEPARPGDVLESQADIGLAQDRLGYTVGVGFSKGLTTTVDWYRANSLGATG